MSSLFLKSFSCIRTIPNKCYLSHIHSNNPVLQYSKIMKENEQQEKINKT